MSYRIISPIVAPIYGLNPLDAIKNWVKINHNLGVHNLIVQDMTGAKPINYNANVKYYDQDGRNKVGINMFPSSVWSTPVVTKDGTYVAPSAMPAIVPTLGPVVGPMMSPIVPIAPLYNPFSPISPRLISEPTNIPGPMFLQTPTVINFGFGDRMKEIIKQEVEDMRRK
jgi:hypothetical protein